MHAPFRTYPYPIHSPPGMVYHRFPIELDADTIVVPYLFEPLRSEDGDAYTLGTPSFAVFPAQTARHMAFLREEVVPALAGRVPLVILVDSVTGQFSANGAASRPLAELAGLVNAWVGYELVGEGALDDLLLGPPGSVSDELAVLEARPIRFWEAMIWRGRGGRYELIRGEVPLVAELGSERAADRTFMQCIVDAERLFGEKATESGGWVRVGPSRLRRRGSEVEIRVALGAADRRFAFLPRIRLPGADGLPSLVGALLVGGDKGKCELVDGYTWVTLECADEAEAGRVTSHLAAEVRARIGAEVVRVEDGWVGLEGQSSWRVTCDQRWMRLWMPLFPEPLAVYLAG